MSRRRRDLPRYQAVKQFTDPFPEHEKMAPYVEANWAIRDFLNHLEINGAQLVCEGHILTDDEVEEALLRFRGVDPAAFRAESGELLAKYGGHAAAAIRGASRPHADVSYPNAVRVINILDRLGVPAWAGRPACRTALKNAGLPLPETGLFAKAVKLRKSQYGITDQYTGQPELPLPEPVVKQVEVGDDSLASLLGRIREE